MNNDANKSYIAKADDEIDMGLANEVNSISEKEKLNFEFERESEGVYKFGNRRVYVKIGQTGQIIIKVGGGYMTVPQFIEKFNGSEVQRLHHRANSN